jgi:glycosyltransferase involved in cell wall biosynthesis
LTQIDKEILGKKRTNVVVIPNPLTFPAISEEEYTNLYDSRKHVLACGSVDRYYIKGFDSLIRAFSLAARNHKDWILDIAGGGSKEKINELKRIARECDIFSQVVFLGFRNDIEDLMKSHILFAHAPRTEGFGMVLTEAMACGCPVICYNLSGPSEIVHHNVDGVLVESQNIDDLALAINSLMCDSPRRFMLGKNALENVKRFSISTVVDDWEALFKQGLE